MLYGLLSGLLSGLNTVLLSVALSIVAILINGGNIFLVPFITNFLHDFFSSIWITIYMIIKGEFKDAISNISTSTGRFIIVGAFFAGPVGMTGYLLAIGNIGPAYTAIISAIYPAIGALFSYIFLKEKMSYVNITGLLLSITGVMLLGTTGEGDIINFVVGFIWALVAVFGWASEAVICSYAMRKGTISPEQSLQLRQLTSATVYGVLIIPLLGAIGETINISLNKVVILIMSIALSATVGCLMYYKGIKKIGAIRAMSLNITYSAWSVLFGVIVLGNKIDVQSIICCILIMTGSVIAAVKKNPT